MAIQRGYSAASFCLEIEGKFAGWLSAVEGGEPFGEVVETSAASGPTDKSISELKYADITFTCGVPDATLTEWLVDFCKGKAPIRGGAVVFFDNTYQATRRLEWDNGHLGAVTLPRLDGSSKDLARMTITIRPEVTRSTTGVGAATPNFNKASLGKSWLASNFTVQIPGIDCSRVASVEPITISQEFVPAVSRRGAPKPGPLKVADLVLTASESHAADFVAWRDDFLVRGNHGNAQEKSASIRYLGPNLKAELFSVSLQSLGIYRLASHKQGFNVDVIARATASMYCEQAELVFPAIGAAPAAPTAPGEVGPNNLREFLGVRLETSEVARRLQDTRDQQPVRSAGDRQRQLGEDFGVAWAERRASLAELEEFGAVDSDWTSIALPPGHSLSEALEATGVVPLQFDGRLELMRDAMAEGLLAGIVKVMSEVSEDITTNLK